LIKIHLFYCQQYFLEWKGNNNFYNKIIRCENRDISFLNYFFEKLIKSSTESLQNIPYNSNILKNNLIFSEFWNENITKDYLEEYSNNNYFISRIPNNFIDFFKDWPKYELDKFFFQTFSTKSSILFLQGIILIFIFKKVLI
jgi:hypothetical protein